MSTIDDLSPEQIEQIEKRMQKGALSETGFLNSGERLKDVIEKDEQTLQRHGITHKQIADRIESMIGKANRLEQLAQRGQLSTRQKPVTDSSKNLWGMVRNIFTKDVRNHSSRNALLVENLYRVSEFGYFGIQECPFLNTDGKPCQQSTTCDYEIENMETGITIGF